MNINYKNDFNTFNLELTREELKDLQYMLALSFNKLLDDKLFCSSFKHQSKECNRRCESNLDWRDKISDAYVDAYGEEEE